MKRNIYIDKKGKTFFQSRNEKIPSFYKPCKDKIKIIDGIFKLCLYIKFLKFLGYKGQISIVKDYIY